MRLWIAGAEYQAENLLTADSNQQFLFISFMLLDPSPCGEFHN
jgi:hypothetical protein